LEEEDLNRTLTKDEFEKLIDPFMRRFADLLKATLAESGKLKNNILQFRVESSAHYFEP
jgi:molecular chaperone DnaK (HSP70)